MENRRTTRTVGALALALGLTVATAGCAGSQSEATYGERDVGDDEAAVVVDNMNSGVSDLTVYIMGEFGTRRRLGSVGLSGEETFTVEGLNWGGQFRLVGDPLGGGEIESRTFQMRPGTVVEWRIRDNVLYAGQGG